MEDNNSNDQELLGIAEDLELLWKDEHFQRWKMFIDNQIRQLRIDVELYADKYSEVELRSKLAELKVLRANFVDVFPEWKKQKQQIIEDNTNDGEPEQGPIV